MTNKIGVSPKYRHNRVGAVGEEGVEDQEDMEPVAGPPAEPSISSDPQDKKWPADPDDPTTNERSQRNAHTLPCMVSNLRQSEREKRGVVRSQFHSITKLLDKRKIVMTRQQPLCTKTTTPKRFWDMCASEREHQTRG